MTVGAGPGGLWGDVLSTHCEETGGCDSPLRRLAERVTAAKVVVARDPALWSISSPQVLGLCARQVPGPPDDAFFVDCEWELWPDIHKPFAVGPLGLPQCLGPIPGNGGEGGDFDNKDSALLTCCAFENGPLVDSSRVT